MARIAADTGSMCATGSRLASLATEMAAARQAFARVADGGSAAGSGAVEGALASFGALWSASATSIQAGAQHLATGATAAAGAYDRADQSAMPAGGGQ